MQIFHQPNYRRIVHTIETYNKKEAVQALGFQGAGVLGLTPGPRPVATRERADPLNTPHVALDLRTRNLPLRIPNKP